MPTAAKLKQYDRIIGGKYPTITSAYGMADGVKLYLEQSDDCFIQNMFYNYCKSDHYMSTVLLVLPPGRIAVADFNAPGCLA